MDVVVDRVESNSHGTFGVFKINDQPFCVTLEETWLGNKRRESCIPEGTYEAVAYSGTKYKNVWLIKDVPNRSAILIHWGNTERHTAGCLLVGKYFARFGDRNGVADSRNTFKRLRRKLPKKFKITFKNHFED